MLVHPLTPALKEASLFNALAVPEMEIVWIDWTAIVLLALFFILGLFKGFVWQSSRILTLIAAWFLAGYYGEDGSTLLSGFFSPDTSPPELPLFLSYVIIFVLAIVVCSLIAWMVQKLVQRSGLSAYDRIAGGVLGLGTGSLAVVAILACVYMFAPQDMSIVDAAQRSRSMEVSKRALRLMGSTVPEPMQRMFAIDTPETETTDKSP